eukprot:Awhi_evm3s14670
MKTTFTISRIFVIVSCLVQFGTILTAPLQLPEKPEAISNEIDQAIRYEYKRKRNILSDAFDLVLNNFDPENDDKDDDANFNVPTTFLDIFNFSPFISNETENSESEENSNLDNFLENVFNMFLPPKVTETLTSYPINDENLSNKDDELVLEHPQSQNFFEMINDLTTSVFSLFNRYGSEDDDSTKIISLISSFENFFGENNEDETAIFESLVEVVKFKNDNNSDPVVLMQALDEFQQRLTAHIENKDTDITDVENNTVTNRESQRKQSIVDLNKLFSIYKNKMDNLREQTDPNLYSSLLNDVADIYMSLNDNDKVGIMLNILASFIESKELETLTELDEALGNATTTLIDFYGNKTEIVDSLNSLMTNFFNFTQIDAIELNDFEKREDQYVINILKVLESQQHIN